MYSVTSAMNMSMQNPGGVLACWVVYSVISAVNMSTQNPDGVLACWVVVR